MTQETLIKADEILTYAMYISSIPAIGVILWIIYDKIKNSDRFYKWKVLYIDYPISKFKEKRKKSGLEKYRNTHKPMELKEIIERLYQGEEVKIKWEAFVGKYGSELLDNMEAGKKTKIDYSSFRFMFENYYYFKSIIDDDGYVTLAMDIDPELDIDNLYVVTKSNKIVYTNKIPQKRRKMFDLQEQKKLENKNREKEEIENELEDYDTPIYNSYFDFRMQNGNVQILDKVTGKVYLEDNKGNVYITENGVSYTFRAKENEKDEEKDKKKKERENRQNYIPNQRDEYIETEDEDIEENVTQKATEIVEQTSETNKDLSKEKTKIDSQKPENIQETENNKNTENKSQTKNEFKKSKEEKSITKKIKDNNARELSDIAANLSFTSMNINDEEIEKEVRNELFKGVDDIEDIFNKKEKDKNDNKALDNNTKNVDFPKENKKEENINNQNKTPKVNELGIEEDKTLKESFYIFTKRFHFNDHIEFIRSIDTELSNIIFAELLQAAIAFKRNENILPIVKDKRTKNYYIDSVFFGRVIAEMFEAREKKLKFIQYCLDNKNSALMAQKRISDFLSAFNSGLNKTFVSWQDDMGNNLFLKTIYYNYQYECYKTTSLIVFYDRFTRFNTKMLIEIPALEIKEKPEKDKQIYVGKEIVKIFNKYFR